MVSMKLVSIFALCVFCLPMIASADTKSTTGDTSELESENEASFIPRTKRVLTQEEQAALTPKQVFELLEAGNRRFANDSLTIRNHGKQRRKAAIGQFPKAVVLSCLDSRIPVEDVFDCGIGDIFVARVAGNFANTDILGSLEFACKASGSKLVLVLGHDNCGAIHGAIDGVELGNITAMLKNITPAIDQFEDYQGKKSSKNPQFVEMVTQANVQNTIKFIRKGSPILRNMEKNGDIIIVGGIYDMDTAKVHFIRN
ncbi:MAG: carbonic anhydrase family protein [Pirellulaceae bacterium]|nr:carbonic anhydrase family protein [Pirellulaceae bacterium]